MPRGRFRHSSSGRLGRPAGGPGPTVWVLTLVGFGGLLGWGGVASELDRMLLKRGEVFEFRSQPVLRQVPGGFEVGFEVKEYCDVTVVVETPAGRILRHLACGILGEEAPAPFARNARQQALLWDGTDDSGQAAKGPLLVRVSLGLKARFERTLHWSPYRRAGLAFALPLAAPGGVYLLDGGPACQLRLFDHEGQYLRTLYPFPAAQLDAVVNLKRLSFPPEAQMFPVKWGLAQSSLLTVNHWSHGGDWPTPEGSEYSVPGEARQSMWDGITAIAERGERLALANYRLNRLKSDGSSGGLSLNGPRLALLQQLESRGEWKGRRLEVGPSSAVFSPSGEWLYLTGYHWRSPFQEGLLPAVLRLKYESDQDPQPFLDPGKLALPDGRRLQAPSAAACDALGRVYVADYLGDALWVFSEAGELLKTIPVRRPAQVVIHPGNGELYVLSASLQTVAGTDLKGPDEPLLIRLGAFEAPGELGRWRIPFKPRTALPQLPPRMALDAYGPRAAQPVVWLLQGPDQVLGGEQATLEAYRLGAGQLELWRSFGALAEEALGRRLPPRHGQQRLFANPADGCCYVGESVASPGSKGKSFLELSRLDPASGARTAVPLPFDAEDLGFDAEGRACLRTFDTVARFDLGSGKEVPFAYGEERPAVAHDPVLGAAAPVLGALALPGLLPGSQRTGGLGVSPRGRIAAACEYPRRPAPAAAVPWARGGRATAPPAFPGRAPGFAIHLFDEDGQLLCEDALPGVGRTDGVFLDAAENLFVVAAAAPILLEQPYANDASCTLLKVLPGRARILSEKAPLPLPKEERPAGPPQFFRGEIGNAWLREGEWLYGGVGLHGKGLSEGRDCACVAASRPAVDALGRSFVAETDRYRITVLDPGGRTLLRIGAYGNIEDGLPLVGAGGPPKPVALGRDEVGLLHPLNLAVHSDRRLFISDMGNQRILSVQLGYEAQARVPVSAAAGLGERR